MRSRTRTRGRSFECERWRDCVGPSDRLHWSSHHGHAHSRDAKATSQTRPCNPLRQRWYGTRALTGTRMIFLKRRECALISVSLLLLTISCRSQNNSVANENSSTETTVSSTPPFQTKEPDRYRAVRIITTVSATGETVITKNVIARKGELRRNESQVEWKTIAYLETPEGRVLLLPGEKIYTEVT